MKVKTRARRGVVRAAKVKAPAPARPERVPAKYVLRETLRGGQAWSRHLRRGQILRLVDVAGGACVSALFYNAREPLERYNMADTLKAQYTAFLTTGRVLYSDMGRILVSIIADTCGWHDTLSGCGDAATNVAAFGEGGYQQLRNAFHRNARDNFIVELSKRGLGKRDIVANVNFFVRVAPDDAGRIAWVADNSRRGAYVDLRCEMDTLVVLSNTPHPLDPTASYTPQDVDVSVRWATAAEQPGERDRCRVSRPENARGFALTESYAREVEGRDPMLEGAP
ncbi:MAG TPA: urea amidolyase associated protein UAAP1 [Polyangia bacterium]|nr:urea amidolyase associated protein UAAP1 [Polyangia bacterium]